MSKSLFEDIQNMQSQESVSAVAEQNSMPDDNGSFQEVTLIATHADSFGLTKFKPFQKDIILSVLDGKDTVVIQPTGSGKSLCYQFPEIY